ncbi:hypothetical protein BJ508DRAFT_415498 [Ascobolus immersus RN42]|uniref:Uncharacterized protein n=1 Tax=Ascobolus immersus RN42 TaxID=1160509 RepID=A0A3N4I1Y1_ASCIM|nr:hypothetical protein BJ508DRAFT_415498 [Ascobolus immersus RN42]
MQPSESVQSQPNSIASNTMLSQNAISAVPAYNCILKRRPPVDPTSLLPVCTGAVFTTEAVNCWYGQEESIIMTGLIEDRNQSRGRCFQLCNEMRIGQWQREFKACWEDQCEDFDQESNAEFMGYVERINREWACERFGLDAGEPTIWKDGVQEEAVFGYSEKAYEVDVSWVKPYLEELRQAEKDAADAANEALKDRYQDEYEAYEQAVRKSIAVGLRAKKGALLMALVLGSLFSGFM